MTSAPDDPLAAVIIQIAQHSEQIGSIDARETGHHQHLTARLEDLTNRVTSAKTRLDAIGATLTRHDVIIDALHGLDTEVAALSAQLAKRGGGVGDQDSGYQPVPVPRWWKLTGPERDSAIGRLRAWVEQIYGPATDRSRPPSRRAGTSTRSACTPSTGSANSGPPSTSTPNAIPEPSPPRPNGKPDSCPQQRSKWQERPPDALT